MIICFMIDMFIESILFPVVAVFVRHLLCLSVGFSTRLSFSVVSFSGSGESFYTVPVVLFSVGFVVGGSDVLFFILVGVNQTVSLFEVFSSDKPFHSSILFTLPI